ncbi:MAG: efflux RND transporter periplasmic adaptor subunit, partial [Chloroflexota bacterium]|nr:efflux RND transporter periplasmic adaptor subunit [Chloroflexota bacterium]
DGASPAQIQAARDALDQARAARNVLDQDLARYKITAPQAGTVSRVFYRQGEVAGTSVPLVRLSVDGELTLRGFVSMSALPDIRVGQTVPVWNAELNSKSVSGTVTHIADQAEFSSRQAQTDSERNAFLVAVEVAIKNTDNQLKAGMPASVSFTQQTAPSSSSFSLVTASESLTFSGTLEARQTRVASEVTSGVKLVRVDQGNAVKSGDALIDLDDSTIRSSLSEADAAMRSAQSNLDQVRQKVRAGERALAQAGVAQAQAELQAAQAARDDANRALVAHQDLDAQLHVWQGKAKAAQADVGRADAALASIKDLVTLALSDQAEAGKTRLAILQKQQQAVEANLAAAQATLQGALRVVGLYQMTIDHPLELIAAQHSAEGQLQAAQAGLQVAQAELDILTRAPQLEAVAVADARLRVAQANQGIVQAQAKRYAIASPTDGTIVARSVEPGETVQKGSPLLTIADTRELELTIFVPIRNLGAVHIGQAASVRLPSIAGRTFAGKVTFISPESEFKPANIYNSQERSEIVFSVRVTVPNSNGELKAGLPADATLGN